MTDTEDPQSNEDISTGDTSPPENGQATPQVPDAPGTPTPGGNTALLHELVATIRASVAPGVSPETRATGAAACRAILTALEAQAGQPLIAATSSSTTARATPESASPLARMLSQFTALPREQITGLLGQLAAMPREQLMEFLINRLRGALPPGAPIRAPAGPRFHLVQLPQARRPGSGG